MAGFGDVNVSFGDYSWPFADVGGIGPCTLSIEVVDVEGIPAPGVIFKFRLLGYPVAVYGKLVDPGVLTLKTDENGSASVSLSRGIEVSISSPVLPGGIVIDTSELSSTSLGNLIGQQGKSNGCLLGIGVQSLDTEPKSGSTFKIKTAQQSAVDGKIVDPRWVSKTTNTDGETSFNLFQGLGYLITGKSLGGQRIHFETAENEALSLSSFI